MELKAWAVIGKKKSFWGKELRRWTVGVVDTATEACQATDKLKEWSKNQLELDKEDVGAPCWYCPWDMKWSLKEAKRIEYSFEPLFVFPNYVKE